MIKRRKFAKRSKVKTGKFIKSNQKTVFLVFIFIIGLFSGAFSIKNADAQTLVKIKEISENYLLMKNTDSVMQNFISSAVTDLVFIGVSAVFGLCLAGAPLLWALPAVRGLGIGIILGYIYSTYSVDGLLYAIAAICIPASFSVCALIISCKESILTVKDIQLAFANQKEINTKQYYKLYILRNIILYIVMLFSAALGSVVVLLPNVSLPA